MNEREIRAIVKAELVRLGVITISSRKAKTLRNTDEVLNWLSTNVVITGDTDSDSVPSIELHAAYIAIGGDSSITSFGAVAGKVLGKTKGRRHGGKVTRCYVGVKLSPPL